MPKLYVPPVTTSFDNPIPNNNQAEITLSIPYFNYNNIAYPRQQPRLLALFEGSIGASASQTLLAVAATEQAFVSAFYLQLLSAGDHSLLAGGTIMLTYNNLAANQLLSHEFSEPFVWGVQGDDIILQNNTAGARTFICSVFGLLLTGL